MKSFPVRVQHRHVHLSLKDTLFLFGSEDALTPYKDIDHAEQMVYTQTVSIQTAHGRLTQLHVVGPSRVATQVELSPTDAFVLGLRAPVRVSGDLSGAALCRIVAGKKSIRARFAIVPSRHLHLSPKEAKQLHVSQHQVVTMQDTVQTDCVLEDVVVRVHPTFASQLHIHADDAASHWITESSRFSIISTHLAV